VITGTGSEMIVGGDQAWDGTLDGSGRLVSDVTPPQTRANIVSTIGPPDGLLPWDPIGLEVAEPVDANGFEKDTLIQGANGQALSMQWDSGTPSAASWAGATRYAGYIADWTDATSGEKWALKSPGSAARDRAGHDANSLSQGLSLLGIGSP